MVKPYRRTLRLRPGFAIPARCRSLKLFLYLGIALAAVSLGSQLLELQLLNEMKAGGSVAPGAADGNDLRQQVVAVLRLVNLVVVVVLFCIWIYRASYNARQLGATDMRFSPGWAVGWYFIPIANLWKPYQAMCEIWQASANPAHWQQQPRGPILPLWWTFFLLSNFLGNASFRLSLRANTLPDLVLAGIVQGANDVVDIASTAIALVLVGQIFRMQMARRAADAFA
jgi:Domain of unknown function (DUF4328)